MNEIPFYKQKTFWTSVGFIIAGLLSGFTNVLTKEQIDAIMTTLGGLTAIFMRQGIERNR